MKKFFFAGIFLLSMLNCPGQFEMKIHLTADSIVKYLVLNNMAIYLSPFADEAMTIYAQNETFFMRRISAYTTFNNHCVEYITAFMPKGDKANYTQSCDLMQLVRERWQSQIVREERTDDRTIYKLMVQDVPSCFGIAYIKKMNVWCFFTCSALIKTRLDDLVTWLTDDLNLDYGKTEKSKDITK